MKTMSMLMVILLALFSFPGFAQQNGSRADRQEFETAPGRNARQQIFPVESDNYWQLLWAVPVGVGGGEAGIESDGDYIYTTKWNGDEFYRYNMDGVYMETFTCGAASQIRDLAYDGTYFYGGAAGTTVYEMDFDNQVVVSTFTSPVAVRAIAYDDYHDGFYANNWSTEITLFNRSGVVLNSFSPWYYENYYGFAYDNVDGSGPFLWGFSQDGSGGVAVQMELPSGYETGFTYDIVAELGGPGDLAGGCAFVDLGSDYVFLGMVQNLVICAYSLFSFPTDHDIGIQQIVQPSSGQNLGMEPITISIKNYGYFPEAGIPWEVTWNDTSYSDIYPDTILPGFNAEITLPVAADLSEPGEYVFEACTYLEGDQNTDNNCKTKVVEHQIPGYCTDFLYSDGCSFGDGLISWQLANIDIPEIPCSGTPEWYHDYTDSIHQLAPGGYVLTVEAGYSSTYFDFWINYNDDFEFTDDELLIDDGLCEAANTSYSFVITIPDTVPSGEFHMRYRTNWAAPVTDPCETYSYGNCCDFTAEIVNEIEPQITIEPNLLYEEHNFPPQISTQELLVINKGDGILEWDMELDSLSPWLTAQPQSAFVDPFDTVSVSVTFNSEGLSGGEYNSFFIFYSNDPENPTIYIVVELMVDMFCPFAPPQNVIAWEEPAFTANLAWEEPPVPPGVIRWDDGVNDNGIGLAEGNSFMVAARWDPEQLELYHGLFVQAIDFFPRSDYGAEFTLKAWTGADGMTEVMSQQVNVVNYQWNSIILEQSLQIDANSDLWIGYEVENIPGDYPAGVDAGPALAGYGDMIRAGGSWASLMLDYGIDANWNIAVHTGAEYLEKPAGESVTLTPKNYTSEILPVMGSPTVSEFRVWKNPFVELLGYNVYLKIAGNYVKLNSALITGLSFSVENMPIGTPEFLVCAFYNLCESCTYYFCTIAGLNEPDKHFPELYPNPANTLVSIKSAVPLLRAEIIDLNGQIVYSELLSGFGLQIGTTALPSGIYILKLLTAEGISNYKLIIQH